MTGLGRNSGPDPSHGRFLRSARVVSLLTLVSRVLGLLRDAAMANVLGAGAVHDALAYAWTMPNAFRRLFGEGALSTAFVPVFSRVAEHEGRARAGRLARELVTLLGLSLLLLAAVLALAVGSIPDHTLARLFGPDQLQKARLTVRYLQLLLPYLAAICVIAQFMAVLNALDEFTVPALAPILLNLTWLAGVGVAAWWGAGRPADFSTRSDQGLIVVGAILLAAVLQFAWHLPSLASHGVAFRPVRPRFSPELRQVAVAMGPMLLAMGSVQINLVADRSVALLLLPDGATTHLYYGLRVQQFPMGLVTSALATTAFPAMARLVARSDRGAALATAGLALRTNLLVALPATVGLALLAGPVVTLLFQSGAFGAQDAALTARALSGYALGIPFAGTVMLLQRACYAAHDTRLPLRVGLVAVLVNLVLDLVLVGPLGELGLALATSLSAALAAGGLLLGVRRRFADHSGERLLGGMLPALSVSLLLCLAVMGVDGLLEGWLQASRAAAALRVAAGTSVGLAVFALCAPRLCPREWSALSSFWRRGPASSE